MQLNDLARTLEEQIPLDKPPIAMADGQTSQSLGCTGMRINSGISDEYMLMAVPHAQLASLAESLGQTSEIHTLMAAHYNEKAAGM